jgi:hypothetical protein
VGRTKASTIAQNVLGIHAIEKRVKILEIEIRSFPYQVMPLIKVIENVSTSYSILHKRRRDTSFLDFYEDPNEKSEAIYKNIKTRLEKMDFKLRIS